MQKGCLANDLHHIFIHAKCCCKRCCIIGHIRGMAECIMILCIDCRCQGIDGWFIFLVNMCPVCWHYILVGIAEHGIKDLDPVLSTVFHMVNCKIHILQQFLHIFCRIRCRTDSRTDRNCFQLHVRPAVIHNRNLLFNGFHQVSGREKIISRQQNSIFFSTVTCSISVFSHTALDDFCNALETQITFF